MAAAAAALDALNEVHDVLIVCGFTNQVTRDRIILNEGFNTIGDIGEMEEDTDVTEMAKRLSSRTIAEGRVLIQTKQLKRLQVLVWWIRDRKRHGQTLDGEEFTEDAMALAKTRKRIEREGGEDEGDVGDLPKFDPDNFETMEDAFKNLLASKLKRNYFN